MKLLTLLARVLLALAAAEAVTLADPAVPPMRVLPKLAFTLADLEAQTPRNKDGSFVIEVPEIVNLGLTEEARAVLTGKPVETIGQVVPEPVNNAEGKRVRIVRSSIGCCAVHARQYSVIIEFPGKAPDFKEMSWVKVVGTMGYKVEDGNMTAVVAVRDFKETATPANPVMK